MRPLSEIKRDVDVAVSMGNRDDLERLAEEARALASPEATAIALIARGMYAALSDDHENALQYFNQALTIHTELNDEEGIAFALSNIGSEFEKMGDYDAALEQYYKSLSIHTARDNGVGISRVSNNLGIVYAKTGNYAAALEHFHRSLAFDLERGNRADSASTIGNIALVYEHTGDYPAALDFMHRALAIHEETGNVRGMALVTGNIGTVYVSTADYAKAIEFFQRALPLHEEVNNRASIARITANIGTAYRNSGNIETAVEHYSRAIALHEELGNKANTAFAMGQLIGTHIEAGMIAEARALAEKVTSIHVDDPRTNAIVLGALARIHEYDEEYDAAATIHRKALDVAHEAGMRPMQADIHKALRDIAQKQNDFASYIEHNNEYTRITEEIKGKDATTRLAMQEAERNMATERELQAKESERIANERERERAVLYSTLPKHIADRVIRGEAVNDHIDHAAVMFLDIVGFTTLSSTLTSQQVITLLDAVFKICDEACSANNVTRIKTIGDSYMAFSRGTELDGVGHSGTELNGTSACMNIARAALQIIERVQEIDFESLFVASGRFSSLQVRIGLHCGPVTAGVLGNERLQYDVWGDTVNVASRMESTSEPNKIHISEQFKNALHSPLRKGEGPGESSRILPRGAIEIKGKGTMQTFWLMKAVQ